MKEVVAAMGRTGQYYKGILYGQFMNTASGPKVIEFNARFGDPEAMNVLSLLTSDLSEIVSRIAEGSLSEKQVAFAPLATVCKYIVPEGYPDAPRAGEAMTVGKAPQALLYYANVEQKNGQLFTQSSRTLAYVGIGDTLESAEHAAEKAASAVTGRVFHRSDIGTGSLLNQRIAHMKELR
jgi:phosphoribosylamine--glycine ligase